MSLAVVGSSGGMKAVFVQGALNALETGGVVADAYAGVSGSALPAAGAAIKHCNFFGTHYWQRVNEVRKSGKDLGETMLIVMEDWVKPPMSDLAFMPGAPRLMIPASAVITEEGVAITQGEGAKKLGRQLIVQAGRGDKSWIEKNLELHVFDTQAEDERFRITSDNIGQVIYASLRLLHNAHIPAWVNGQAYIDGFYLCMCPALEVAKRGFDELIVIYPEPGQVYRDIFQQEPIPNEWNGTKIHVIQPAFDLATVGATITECTDEGLLAAFYHGEEQTRKFLAQWSRN